MLKNIYCIPLRATYMVLNYCNRNLHSDNGKVTNKYYKKAFNKKHYKIITSADFNVTLAGRTREREKLGILKQKLK